MPTMATGGDGPTDEVLDHTDPEDLQRAYDEADGNISKAAERFEITYGAVYDRMRRHGVHESQTERLPGADEDDATEDEPSGDSTAEDREDDIDSDDSTKSRTARSRSR